MYRYSLHLALLATAVLANPSRLTESPTEGSPSDGFPSLEDVCLFGEFPSMSCKAKCDSKSQEAYCDTDQNACLCRDRQLDDEIDDLMSLHSHLDEMTPTIRSSSHFKLGHASQNTESQSDDAPLIEDMCILGELPSLPCKLKCEAKSQEAYCDKEQNLCLCRDSEFQGIDGILPLHNHLEGLAPTIDLSSFAGLGQAPETADNPDESQDGSFLTTFYVFNLDDLFGYNTTNDTESVYNETGSSGATDGSHDKVSAGWFTPHIIAMIIVILLCALILLELFACYRKRKDKNRMDMIFPNSTSGISQKQ